MLIVGCIVFRVRDMAAQIDFWTHALDYEVREPIKDDFVVMRPRDGKGPELALDAHHSERVLPPRMHLDLYADDQSAEVERLRGLGSRVIHWDGRPADADYVIMEDPEGNRFCVIDASGMLDWNDRRSN